MMKILTTCLLVGLAVAAAAAPPSFVDEAKSADVVFAGKLVKVDPAPRFWSGGAVAFQKLTYDVTDVLRGTETRKQVVVPFVIVGGAPYVDGKQPEVVARLVKVGDSYIVAERQTKEWGLIAIDAAPATPDLAKAIRAKP